MRVLLEGGPVEEADAICCANERATASLSARLEALARTGFSTPSERAVAAMILRRGLPHLAREIAALRRLPVPADDARIAATMIGSLGEKRLIGEGLARAFERGSGPETRRLVRTLVSNEERTARLSRRLGLRSVESIQCPGPSAPNGVSAGLG
jgi:hypothetical protein